VYSFDIKCTTTVVYSKNLLQDHKRSKNLSFVCCFSTNRPLAGSEPSNRFKLAFPILQCFTPWYY
jgi:hypothetical protein